MLRHAIALPGSCRPAPDSATARRGSFAARTTLGALTLAAVLSAASAASAQSQDAIAEKLNEEGKALMLNRKPEEASKRFADAAARSPNPRYFYNLCKAYHFQGLFFEAMDACGSARKNSPDESLAGKIGDLEQLVRDEAAKQNIDLSKPPVTQPPDDPTNPPDPTHPPDPTQPDPNPNGSPTVVRGVPPKNLYTPVAPRHEYVWTLGLDLTGGSSNLGGNDRASFAGLRLRLDYMLLPSLQIGAQGFVDLLEISSDDNSDEKMAVSNFGGAVYKHFCANRFCVTPLVGAQIGAIDNTGLGENEFETFAVGGRAELGVSAALGTRYEHVLGVQLGVLAYAKPGESDELMLDKGGNLPYIALGYTYRFNTPFGSAPILGLE